MTSYKLYQNENGETTCIVRSDGWAIPLSEGNTDYQEYLEWLAEGNEPLPAE